MSGKTSAIGADSSFYEDETKFMKVCEGFIHGIKQVCVMLEASRIICEVEKDCKTPDHFVWYQSEYSRKINL